MTHQPHIRFARIHNAHRSLMTVGYLKALSDGSEPGTEINPIAIQAMREENIDMSESVPRLMLTEAVQVSDVVITMRNGHVCPIFPGTRDEDGDQVDPRDKSIDDVLPTRDDIEACITVVLAETFSTRA